MRPVVRKLSTCVAIAALSCSVHACTQPLGEEAPSADEFTEQPAELSLGPQALRSTTRRTLVDGLTAAENQLFTSSGRLFVSGDEGIYEIIVSSSGTYESRAVLTGESCAFGGLTEYAGAIYANCYDFANSAVYASLLTEQLDFRVIHRLPGTALLNGLTNDGAGSLFLASSLDGRIIQLRVSPMNPLAIASEGTFDAQSGFVTNGLEYFEQKLYWTAFTDLNVARVRTGGTLGLKRRLARAITFFDDIYVDAAGILVADYLNGSVIEFDLNGRRLDNTENAVFEGPSSVQRANGRLGLSIDALIVTERTANRVSVLE